MSVQRRSYKKRNGGQNTYYRAVIKMKGLTPITKQFERKIDAENWEREQRVNFKADPRQQTFNHLMTVDELCDHWIESYAKNSLEWSSVHRYEGMLRIYVRPAFGSQRLMDLTPAAGEMWLYGLVRTSKLATKTANGCLGLLRKILNDAVRWRFVAYNPLQGVKPLRVTERDFDFWTLEEGERFLSHARSVDRSLFYVVAIALYSGLRSGEIQALQWDCVDLANRMITVKRTFCLKEMKTKERTKTKRIRRIPINTSLQEILMELRRRTQAVAASGAVQQAVVSGFDFHHASRIIRKVSEEAGVKPIRFHDLRHSVASNFMMRGGQIYKLQRLLGHTSIQMTERYSHLSPDHLNDATELLDFGTRTPSNVLPLRAIQ